MSLFSGIRKRVSLLVGNTLYYPGCMTKYAAPELFESYKKILDKLEINYITIPEQEFCCGSPVLHAGYRQDFENLVKKNKELFRKYGISRIITNCPACYYMFSKYYPELKAEHLTQTIMKKASKLNGKNRGQISYHDPCHLGRHSNIYDEPRKILEVLGYEVVELEDNKSKSLCCGAGAGVKTNFPETAKKVAKKRLQQCKTKKIVTPCPLCYKHMRENAEGIDVLELSEVIDI